MSAITPQRRAPNADIPLWAELGWQIVLITFAFFFYFGVRGATEGNEATAFTNAERLTDLQERLGIMWEPGLQGLIADHQSLITLSNWVYIWGHWPVIGVVAIWLFSRHRDGFFLLRNAIFISGAIGLIFFLTIPVAPPRLVEGLNVIDTVTEQSRSYRALQPPALVNQYAAFPSLHFGFNMLMGIVLFRHARHISVKVFAVALPTAMAVAVVLTANHFVLDVVGGTIVALVGLWIAIRLRDSGRGDRIRAAIGPRLRSQAWIGRPTRRSASHS
ncbi:MAG: phosphatase PAP2 family protein [Thermoleophilia bacterium]|nr:phosphatase PAP2 family protein [Thermoleophilia bacterium]MDH3725725.1 phosphatase PAP2 family protein [Thermoleophilia bacterium]